MTTNPTGPGVAVNLERAHSLANDAVRTVALQYRRLHGREPEDDSFIFRWWADLQFFIIALRRLRGAALVAAEVKTIEDGLQEFDRALPDLPRMRNVGEHIDAYALDSPKRHDKGVDRKQVLTGTWDGRVFEWLGGSLDIDMALAAAEKLYFVVRDAMKAVARDREASGERA